MEIINTEDLNGYKFEQILASSSHSKQGSKRLLAVVTCLEDVSTTSYKILLNNKDHCFTDSLKEAIDQYNSLG